MRRDLRALAAIFVFIASHVVHVVLQGKQIERLADWERNGDPCFHERAKGWPYSFCEPVAPRIEVYLGWTWLVLIVTTMGLLIWIFWKPIK